MNQDKRWRVLIVHNGYQQRGGEDSVVESEKALLERAGHHVAFYGRHNDEVDRLSRRELLAESFWSKRTQADIAQLVTSFQPDVIHVHNTWPLVSPSVYGVARQYRIPVVQTLHNFRLMCPQAMFLRQGRVCEDCLGKVPWRGVVRACYRDSAAQTAALASVVTWHRWRGTYDSDVTRFIALNEFCRDKFVAGGLPAKKMAIKSNFVDDPGLASEVRQGGLFVGRLSEDKGIGVLLSALKLGGSGCDVIGGGEMLDAVRMQLGDRCLGFMALPDIMARMRRASYLVMPSLWYENFPRTLVEAYANGLPVIASRIGALAELVEEGVTGLLFEPGDPDDLATKMAWANAHPERMLQMGAQARSRYEARYTPEANLKSLIQIYEDARAALVEGAGAALA